MRIKILALAIVLSVPLMFNSCKESKEEAMPLSRQISTDESFISFLTDYSAFRIMAYEADPQLIAEGISQAEAGIMPDLSSAKSISDAYATMISVASNLNELFERYPALNRMTDQELQTVLLEAGKMAALPVSVERLDPSLASQADFCQSIHNLGLLVVLLIDLACYTDDQLPTWLCDFMHALGSLMIPVFDNYCDWCLNDPPCF